MKRLLWLVALICFTTLACAGQIQDRQREALDKWFDGLTYSKYVGAPFVKITAHWADSTYDSYGLLISPSGEPFVVVGLDLFKSVYQSHKDRTYTVEPVEFRSWVLALRKKFLADSASGKYHVTNIPNVFDQDQVFFISRIARAKGMKDIEDLCYKWARESEVYVRVSDADHFVENLRDAFQEKMVWDATLQVGDYRIPREDIVPLLKNFVANFPDSKLLAKGKLLLSQLEAEIQESRAHKPIAGADAQAQIDELIYQLRDQCGYQFSQPGSCDVFLDPRGENSPAARLVKVGLPAVPKLIEAITDDSPSRSVGYWKDYTFSHHILTVGDVACAVITKISSANLYDYSQKQTPAESRLKFKAAAVAWWNKVQSTGEEKALADIVADGGPGAVHPARELSSKFPASLLAAVKAGVANTKGDVEAADLASVVLLHPSPANEAFAKEIHTSAKGTALRIAAAQIEAQYDLDEAIRWGITAWKQEPAFTWLGRYSSTDFLLRTRSIVALRAIAEKLKDRPSDIRFDVLSALVDPTPGPATQEKAVKNDQLQKEYDSAVEGLLVSELSDDGEISVPTWKVGKYELSTPKLGLVACADLAVLFPEKYRFETTPSFFEQSLLIAQAANTWRKGKGLALLPLPTRRAIATVSEAEIDRRISAVCEASSASDLVAAKDRLLSTGLPMVWRLAKFLADKPNAAHAAALDAMCRTVANTVSSVELSPDLRSNAALTEHLNAMKGKTLEPDFFDALLPLLPAAGNGNGFELRVQRDNDGRGVTLTIKSSAGQRPTLGAFDFISTVNGVLANTYGGDIGGEATANDVREILNGPPLAVFDIRIRSS